MSAIADNGPERPLVFGLTPYRRLVASISGIDRGAAAVDRFPNRELHARVAARARGRDCVIVGSITPPEARIGELTLLADTLRRGAARSVTAVVPYLAYARQDRADAGESLGLAWAGALLGAAGIDAIVTVDVHSRAAPELPPFVTIRRGSSNCGTERGTIGGCFVHRIAAASCGFHVSPHMRVKRESGRPPGRRDPRNTRAAAARRGHDRPAPRCGVRRQRHRAPGREGLAAPSAPRRLLGMPVTSLPATAALAVALTPDWASADETERALRRRVPPAATPLGAALLRAGCRWLKDWHFAEGGREGHTKLQGELPRDDAQRRRQERALRAELEAFLAGTDAPEADRARARKSLATLGAADA